MSVACLSDGSEDEVERAGEPEAAEARGAGLRAEWPSAGRDLNNTRHQPLERRISPRNAGRLGVKWYFETEGDVWAIPSVDDMAVYVPDGAGNLFAVERWTGKLRWKRRIGDYTGVPNAASRATPTIHGDVLYLGDQAARTDTSGAYKGATLIAIDKRSGEKLWSTRIDDHPLSRVTQAAVVYGDRVYVGVSSIEERAAAAVPGYECCSFRGSMVALDRHTGAIVWKTYLTPGSETPGFSGVAVWGSNPVIDPARNSIYITTGNNYKVPTAVLDCQSLPTPEEVEACVREVPGSEDNHFDAIVSLDLRTGKINWAHSMVPFDSWNISCVFAVAGNEGNCTDPHGEDYDFGQGPILYTARIDGRPRQLLAAGQKSGIFWAVDPDDGAVVWKSEVGPGGSLGGMEWGSAYDGRRIYTAVANSAARPWTQDDGTEATSGLWAALDPATGKVLWRSRGEPAVTTANQGPVTVANGVVYGGTINLTGTMYALDAATGRTLWSFESGGSVDTAPAIVDGTLYWGSGYGVRGLGLQPNNVLYAFEIGGNVTPPPRDAGLPPVPMGRDGGQDGGLDAGLSDLDAGPRDPDAPTWREIYDRYLGGGATVGHCQNCHLEMASAESAYAWLTGRGQIDGTSSKLVVRGQSRLTWFGGGMPIGGPASQPDAEADMEAWVAAGALLD